MHSRMVRVGIPALSPPSAIRDEVRRTKPDSCQVNLTKPDSHRKPTHQAGFLPRPAIRTAIAAEQSRNAFGEGALGGFRARCGVIGDKRAWWGPFRRESSLVRRFWRVMSLVRHVPPHQARFPPRPPHQVRFPPARQSTGFMRWQVLIHEQPRASESNRAELPHEYQCHWSSWTS